MIAATITRLDTVVTSLLHVGGAAEFQAAADANPTATPAAYVLLADESAEPSRLENFVLQRFNASLAVVLVCRNLADPKGAAALVDMIALRQAVRTALLGWSPTASCDPLQFDRGALMAFRNGHLWWQDIYRTSYLEKSQ